MRVTVSWEWNVWLAAFRLAQIQSHHQGVSSMRWRATTFIVSLSVISCWMVTHVNAQSDAKTWEANPDLVAKKQKGRGDFNYREDLVPKYDLPNPLIDDSGASVSQAAWTSTRRQQILDTFRKQVYGVRPSIEYAVAYKVLEEKAAFDGAAVGYSMNAIVTVEGRKYEFPFVLFIPSQASKPVPGIIHINNRYFVPLDKAMNEPDPFWPVKSIVEKGYATASFHTSDVDPDDKNGYAKGIRSFFANGKAPAPDDWRSLSAWGWAASRILDYLDTLENVDATRVAVVGHSRGGKTSLWAASEDERFAIAYSNNSGCGGAALSRRAYGETVARITEVFPHWFCENYARYGGKEDELPVDQHEVMALIAPRAIYVTSADEDLWADPRGEYTSLVASAPVYSLLGMESIVDPVMPALNQPRSRGKTGYHIRTGGHGLTQRDWDWFLEFADIQLK